MSDMLSNAFPFGTCTNEEMDRFFHVLDKDDKATDIIVDRCYDCHSGDRGEVEQLDIGWSHPNSISIIHFPRPRIIQSKSVMHSQ